jgi:hypothetical protein
MASALYLMQVRGESPRAALRTFSLSHGHIPLGGTGNLHALFREYEAHLQSQGIQHTPEKFRAWVAHEYNDAGSEDEPDWLFRIRQERIAGTPADRGW